MDSERLANLTLQHLQTVDHERQLRHQDPQLEGSVDAVKAFQRQRFAATYADLLSHPRYQGAARFFLNELYGPQDHSQRDAQFARVVPALAKLFPLDVLHTVNTLAELHALSEQLDTHMGRQLQALGHRPGTDLSAPSYTQAWRATGQSHAREQQIAMTESLARALDGYTRKPLLRHALRMMRGPAAAAGLSHLQHFLEQGFDTFKAMGGSREFMATIGQRERSLAAALFQGHSEALP